MEKSAIPSQVPADGELAAWVEVLEDSVLAPVRAFTVLLTPEQRRRTVTMRPGARRVLDIAGAQARKFGLSIPNASVDDMNDDYTLALRLAPLRDAAASVAGRLDDTMLDAQSRCWWAATGYYKLLDRMSGADAGLDQTIEEVRAFFRLGPRPAATEKAQVDAADSTEATPVKKRKGRDRPRTQMLNLVGHDVPSESARDQYVAILDDLYQRIAPFTLSLTASQRKKTLKMRPGARRVLDVVGGLATQYGLSIPGASVEEMNRAYSTWQRLRPAHDQAALLVAYLEHTILMAQSECWWAATAYYSMLDRMSGADTDLDKAIEELREFFRLGPRATDSKDG